MTGRDRETPRGGSRPVYLESNRCLETEMGMDLTIKKREVGLVWFNVFYVPQIMPRVSLMLWQMSLAAS